MTFDATITANKGVIINEGQGIDMADSDSDDSIDTPRGGGQWHEE